MKHFKDHMYENDNFIDSYYEKPNKIMYISEERILWINNEIISWELTRNCLKLVERSKNLIIFHHNAHGNPSSQKVIINTEANAIKVYNKLIQIVDQYFINYMYQIMILY